MEKEKLLEFKQVKDAVISKKYIAINFKVPLFRVNPDSLFEVFDYLDSEGYTFISELGIDCNKFIFKKKEE